MHIDVKNFMRENFRNGLDAFKFFIRKNNILDVIPNDNVKKVTGGRNGYGAKLTNIFSKTFIVETANQDKRKKYKQKFYNNMLKFEQPEIKEYNGEDYTCITFEPDLARFGMEKMDEDIVALFKKRVYDMAGITPKGVNVYLNKEKLQVENFEKYITNKYFF